MGKGCEITAIWIADFTDFYALAEKQSVLGLVAAALEHVEDMKLPQNVALTLVESALQLEQRNQTMNEFVAELIWSLRREGVYAILVKGQAIA